jgi:hypothetical protein
MALNELTEQLVAQGVDPKQAELVSEAAERKARARENHQVFFYADAEHGLEEMYRSYGASPELIEDAKEKVWKAARETSAENGCTIEEALFFCFHEAADYYREFLAVREVIASDVAIDIGPKDEADVVAGNRPADQA